MSRHHYSYYNSDANQCRIEIVECTNCQTEEPAQLAALREAGEKMADALRVSQEYSEYCKRHPNKIIEYIEIFNIEDAAALEAWEAATK
jgi:hypothetical protein